MGHTLLRSVFTPTIFPSKCVYKKKEKIFLHGGNELRVCFTLNLLVTQLLETGSAEAAAVRKPMYYNAAFSPVNICDIAHLLLFFFTPFDNQKGFKGVKIRPNSIFKQKQHTLLAQRRHHFLYMLTKKFLDLNIFW